MIPRKEIPEPLARLAAAQSGVVTWEQCQGLGLSLALLRRLVSTGQWRRLAQSVYLTHNGPNVWLADAWAGVLIGGDDAALADDAAGYLWRLVAQPPGRLVVEVPHLRRVHSEGPWVFRRTRLPIVAVGDPLRKAAPETVLDLCVAHPDRRAAILADASHLRISLPAILRAADARPRLADRRVIEALLGRTREGIHSELEHIYARDVERAHGLPKGARQFFDGRDRTDVRYGLLVVELDGRAGHVGCGAFRDMGRDNRHALAGLETLRFGYDDCTRRPCEVARQVATMLMRSGWPGPITPCRRCKQIGVTQRW